jgi:transcriptional regulator with XRE-family HTH domain
MTDNNKIITKSLQNSGLKQIKFAERIGVSRSHLSAVVLGKSKASNQLTELVSMKFLPKTEVTIEPSSSLQSKTNANQEEESMYRLKYEEKCEEVIALQKLLLELTTEKKASANKKIAGE